MQLVVVGKITGEVPLEEFTCLSGPSIPWFVRLWYWKYGKISFNPNDLQFLLLWWFGVMGLLANEDALEIVWLINERLRQIFLYHNDIETTWSKLASLRIADYLSLSLTMLMHSHRVITDLRMKWMQTRDISVLPLTYWIIVFFWLCTCINPFKHLGLELVHFNEAVQ